MLIDFRQLFPKYGIKPSGVLHVGANIGEEAPVYDELGIYDVVWIEPNPDLYEQLALNVDKYGHRCYIFCAGDESRDAILHISNNGGQSSSVLDLGTHSIAHPDVKYTHDIPVKMMRIDSYFSGESIKGIDFLNIDTQGFELKVLHGMGDLLHQFKWAYLEVNWDYLYKGCALFNEVKEYMEEYGFIVAEYKECGRTSWGDCLFIRKL